jgi:hypothetical protein
MVGSSAYQIGGYLNRQAAERNKRARELRAKARAICQAEPGYGTPAYRGDPLEAVALQQEAERLKNK